MITSQKNNGISLIDMPWVTASSSRNKAKSTFAAVRERINQLYATIHAT
jgi:DNA phosphorothioation-dependent restriction protein DptG